MRVKEEYFIEREKKKKKKVVLEKLTKSSKGRLNSGCCSSRSEC